MYIVKCIFCWLSYHLAEQRLVIILVHSPPRPNKYQLQGVIIFGSFSIFHHLMPSKTPDFLLFLKVKWIHLWSHSQNLKEMGIWSYYWPLCKDFSPTSEPCVGFFFLHNTDSLSLNFWYYWPCLQSLRLLAFDPAGCFPEMSPLFKNHSKVLQRLMQNNK